jgi:hypothetical protein
MKININQKRITSQKEEGFGRPRKKKKIKMAARRAAKAKKSAKKTTRK